MMQAKDIYRVMSVKLRHAWNTFSSHTRGFTGTVLFAIALAFIAALAVRQPVNLEKRLDVSGVGHLKITDWIAEYYRCPNKNIDKSCTRILQKSETGSYQVKIESLPAALASRPFAQNFSSAPTHVRLTHRLSSQEVNLLETLAVNDSPSLALAGQLTCIAQACSSEDTATALKKLNFGGHFWIQFESKISPEGLFGPQSLPPLVVGQSQLQRIFALQPKPQNGTFMELGFSIFAPVFLFIVSVWAGNPPLLVSLSHLLTARAFWHFSTVDSLAKESLIFTSTPLQVGFAFSAIVFGWLVYTTVEFLWLLSRSRKPSLLRTVTFSSSVAALGFVMTFFLSSGTHGAVQMIKVQELTLLVGSALFLAFIVFAEKKNSDTSRWLKWLREKASPQNLSPNIIPQLATMSAIFQACAMFSAANLIIGEDGNTFNWTHLLFPALSLSSVLYFQPRYTAADIQKEKEAYQQQENLTKFISQLGNTKHRSQALSLVMNFCNRELPKLGFESPTFSENLPQNTETHQNKDHEVCISLPLQVNQQCFGWISARAVKRTPATLSGEKMLESLTTSLGYQLESLHRAANLEQQLNLGQKFVPSQLLKMFSLENFEALDTTQEYRFQGIHICIALRQAGADIKRLTAAPLTSTTMGQLTELINTHADMAGGLLIHQEGACWTVVFNDTGRIALQWVATAQHALQDWSKRLSQNDAASLEFNFGVHAAPVTLRLLGKSTTLRPWIQGDFEGNAAALAYAANQYSASVVVSHDMVASLRKAEGTSDLPTDLRLLDRVWNNKKTATLDVFEFFGGDAEISRGLKQRTLELFSEGVHHYLDGHFEEARHIMQRVQSAHPADREAERLVNILSEGVQLRAA